MKNVWNRFLLLFIVVFLCFFSGISNVNGESASSVVYYNSTDWYDMESKFKNLDIKDYFGEYDGTYFDMCFYKIDENDQILDKIDFGYILITFNPSFTDTANNEVGQFKFHWATFHDDSDNLAVTLNPDLQGKYFKAKKYLPREALYPLNSWNNVNSPTSSGNGPYVRFADEASRDGLNNGICPTYAQITLNGWTDNNSSKRICFTNDLVNNGCEPKSGQSSYDNSKAYTREAFYLCDHTEANQLLYSPVYCMHRYIGDAIKSIRGIDTSDTKYCDLDSDVFVNEVDEIITNMRGEVARIAKADRVEEFVSGLNIVDYNLETGSMLPGSPVYNYGGAITNLISAYTYANDSAKQNCVNKGLVTNEEWDAAIAQGMSYVIEQLNGGTVTGFGSLLDNCNKIRDTEFYKDLKYVFLGIRVATPILVIVLIMKDMISAVAAGKDDEMKKAQKNAIIRIIMGVCIFLLPTIINAVVALIDELSSGTCGIS